MAKPSAAAYQLAHKSLSAASQSENRAPRFLKALENNDAEAQFLTSLAAAAPFLQLCAERHIALVESLYDVDLDTAIEQQMSQLGGELLKLQEPQFMDALRDIKQAIQFLLALGDIAGIHSVSQTTRNLSALAQKSIQLCLDFIVLKAANAGKIDVIDRQKPSAKSGLAVLAMGKLGAGELNYSSDIDLILIYEPEPVGLTFGDGVEPGPFWSKCARDLIRLMQERTASGYVFRTDLRLRPDPSATPLAISIDAAIHYYESRGQNWERAAMIKAAAIAGDVVVAEEFIKAITPFVWRKHLDYAAIADVHAMKKQIHRHKGHGQIAVAGHNVKLGRGGIREIEFFVQTQQLIAGGRQPPLRVKATIDAMQALRDAGWVEPQVHTELTQAYAYLRRVEHCIQMQRDEQTHILPTSEAGLADIALLMGADSLEAFRADLLATMKCVESHFDDLFPDSFDQPWQGGNLVFTGQDPDPETVETLSAMGYARPSDMWRVISHWHFGRHQALQSEKARESLTQLVPSLLQAFAASADPDDALLGFDRFVNGLPRGIQLFAMLQSNPQLLALLTLILTSAPRLAQVITSRPLVFDGMLDPEVYDRQPCDNELAARLGAFLMDTRDHEDRLDRLRIFAAEQKFLAGVRLLTGAATPKETGRALTQIAQLCIVDAMHAAAETMIERHGTISDARLALIAMGKLGSGEMTSGSDVDLLLVYDVPDASIESDGPKPMAASQYFARLTQRLIAALSAPTSEGVLYEVDFRLRPSGNKGPLATSLDAFVKYQREQAWTWEHMALTKARAFGPDTAFCDEIDAAIAEVLGKKDDLEKTRNDVIAMREKLVAGKPERGPFDVKNMRGGLTDIDFIAQYLRLTVLRNLNLKASSTLAILDASDQRCIDQTAKQELIAAYDQYMAIQHILRLCVAEGFAPDTLPKPLLENLCARLNQPSVEHLLVSLSDHRDQVVDIFNTVLGVSPSHKPGSA